MKIARNKYPIWDLYQQVKAQLSHRDGEYMIPLDVEPAPGLLGFFGRTVTAFTIVRPYHYYEKIIYEAKGGRYFYWFSNGNSHPPPGREKNIKLVTRDPDLIAQRLRQYKVA